MTTLDESYRTQVEDFLFDHRETMIVRQTIEFLREGNMDGLNARKSRANRHCVVWSIESTMLGKFVANSQASYVFRRCPRDLEVLRDHPHPKIAMNAKFALTSLAMKAGAGTAQEPLCKCGTGFFDPTPACVYRILSEDRKWTLYIGKGKHPRRATQHTKDYWWNAKGEPVVLVERHDNGSCALAAEAEAIATEAPIYNIQGNPMRGIM